MKSYYTEFKVGRQTVRAVKVYADEGLMTAAFVPMHSLRAPEGCDLKILKERSLLLHQCGTPHPSLPSMKPHFHPFCAI